MTYAGRMPAPQLFSIFGLYNLAAHQLIPGAIAEKKQRSKSQKPQSSSIPRIHISPDIIKTRIIVIHRLEVTPDTLWLRLLGKGRVQRRAIEEFNRLPLEGVLKVPFYVMLNEV
jgi:hypothetical protein